MFCDENSEKRRNADFFRLSGEIRIFNRKERGEEKRIAGFDRNQQRRYQPRTALCNCAEFTVFDQICGLF